LLQGAKSVHPPASPPVSARAGCGRLRWCLQDARCGRGPVVRRRHPAPSRTLGLATGAVAAGRPRQSRGTWSATCPIAI